MRQDRSSGLPSASTPPPTGGPRRGRNLWRWVKGGVFLLCAGWGYLFLKTDARSDPEPARPPAAPATPAPSAAAAATPMAIRDAVPAAPVAKADGGDTLSSKKAKKAREVKAASRSNDEFFGPKGPIPTFIIQFIPEEWEYLKKDNRRNAEATLWEVGSEKKWEGVAVHCKGSAGSFQGPEARPGITISMGKYKRAEPWHGFQRWSLNNGAQDNSLLNEQISCEIARMAGVPASRCSHALLKFQGRDLGLYLFKESFDEDFRSHFFQDPEGDLYDGGFVHEVEPNLEKDDGDPNQRENIKELIAAAQEKDNEKRWARLEKILDVDAFLSYIAIESLTCHWDGYNFNRNNYRVYFDKTNGKAYFFLHGTDQTFNDANAGIVRDPGSLIGGAVMSNPAWKREYRERVERIYNEVLKPIDWPARVVEIGAQVRPALEKANPQWAKEWDGKVEGARQRVAARIAAVGKQLGDMPKPFKFDKDGVAYLKAGEWRQEGGAAAVDAASREGKNCLHIRADGESSASWRRSVALEKGKYRIEARVATAGVIGTKSSSGEGAGLRISGGTRTAPNNATGDTGWQELGYDFEAPGGDVILVAELRASKGEVWFDRDSIRLRQVK